jgi:hypothetical protein
MLRNASVIFKPFHFSGLGDTIATGRRHFRETLLQCLDVRALHRSQSMMAAPTTAVSTPEPGQHRAGYTSQPDASTQPEVAMVDAGPRRTFLGPAAIAVLFVLAVTGAVVDGRRGGAGHITLPA